LNGGKADATGLRTIRIAHRRRNPYSGRRACACSPNTRHEESPHP
jgi:hypothetical protein